MKIIPGFRSFRIKIKNIIFKNFYFPKVKTIVWDIDGTMYRNLKLGRKIYNEYISFVVNKKKINDPKKAEILLQKKISRGMTWSQAAAKITRISEKIILKEVEKKVDRSKFLIVNHELVSMFSNEKIKRYNHYILTNSTRRSVLLSLKVLGLTEKIIKFKKIISLEDLVYVKPHRSCFKMVLDITRASPKTHLMVGDDPITDIIPAKKVGMKTCYISSLDRVTYADLQFSDIYQLSDFLF